MKLYLLLDSYRIDEIADIIHFVEDTTQAECNLLDDTYFVTSYELIIDEKLQRLSIDTVLLFLIDRRVDFHVKF